MMNEKGKRFLIVICVVLGISANVFSQNTELIDATINVDTVETPSTTDSIDVTFNVDLTVPALTGVFNSSEDIVKVVGSFNGWEASNGAQLFDVGNNQYEATIRLDSAANADTIAYKYVLDLGDGEIHWDEPSIDNNVNDNRLLFSANAVDSNGDGVRDIMVGSDVFGLITPISQIRTLPDGAYVHAEAVVTTPNFESATRTSFFVQQEGFGINIFKFGTPARMVQPGDLVRIQGTVETYNGLVEIILDEPETDILTLETGIEVPEPRVVNFHDFMNAASILTDEANVQGALIRLNDLTTDPSTWPTDAASSSTNVFATTADDSVITVRLLAETEAMGVIPSPNLDLIGIAGTFNGAQISPRFASDIVGTAPVAYPEPPYSLGDTVNYNGSFATFELGNVETSAEGWFFDNFNTASTYNIVPTAQDGDGKSLQVDIVYNGSDEIWHSQVINEPLFVAAGDYITSSFWAKADAPDRKIHVYLGLPEAGGYAENVSYEVTLSTEWTQYQVISYYVQDFDEEVSMRFGFSMNFAENDQGTIYIDNLQLVKTEPNYTDVTFVVNTSVARANGNFEPDSMEVLLTGDFDGWDPYDAILMTTESAFDDSLFKATVQVPAMPGDSISYKFIIKDTRNGNIEWESNDPTNPYVWGENQDRFFVVGESDEQALPHVYFSDFDWQDRNPNTYGILPISDVREAPLKSHVAIEGIVTRITYNFVYLQDETAGTMLFSRDYFSADNSLGFNAAVKNGDIAVGDHLKVSGITADYYGQHEIMRIHGWDVVSRGNMLPAPQHITLNDVNNYGELYESEIVRIEGLMLDEEADTLMGNTIYEIVTEDGSQDGLLAIQNTGNSEWAFQPAPDGVFNFEGVVKEYYLSGADLYVYAISPHDYSDIETDAEYFAADFYMEPFASLYGYASNTINLDALGDEEIYSFEMTVNYDPDLMTLGMDESVLTEAFTLESNTPEPGTLKISGAGTTGISTTGYFLTLIFDLKASGTANILVDNIQINEEPVRSFDSYVIIQERLCGDVTGDETVSALDAVSVLRHTVELTPDYPLMGVDSTAADVTGNGDISAFDASKILMYDAGIITELGCIDLPQKNQPEVVQADWAVIESEDNLNTVSVNIAGSDFEVYAVEMVVTLSKGVTFKSVENLPDGWNVIKHTSGEELLISMYGIAPIEQDALDLMFNTSSAQGTATIKAQLTLNESTAPEMAELILTEVPSEFGLMQNYPNPFNPSTSISYTLPEKTAIDLSIFNMLGQKVATLVNSTQDAGTYTVSWRAGNLSSGVYIYRLSTANESFTKRMMLVK